MKPFRTFSSEETKKIGETIARKIFAERGNSGKSVRIFALSGDLGAGKTTFVQGFFKGLGIHRKAQSPTFVLMRRHGFAKSDRGARGNVYHLDVYRLKDEKQLDVLGIKEIISDGNNIILVEWAERVKKIFPKGTAWIKFEYGKKENERKVTIK